MPKKPNLYKGGDKLCRSNSPPVDLGPKGITGNQRVDMLTKVGTQMPLNPTPTSNR